MNLQTKPEPMAAPSSDHPEWPDKAMFAAILLMLAGGLGTAFRLLLPMMVVRQDNLPVLFTDDIPGYELTLCLATLVAGVLSLWRQAAVFAYVGAGFAILSLGMYGLVPFLGLLAVAMMVKSHLEGEETHNDGVQMAARIWPDKAMATSLLLVAVGAVAVLQGALELMGRFDPIVLGNGVLAGALGVAIGLYAFVAAANVYSLRRPWMAWTALGAGILTMGFYLVGPVLAVIGMITLALAHHEDEFVVHAGVPPGGASPSPVRKGRRRKPTAH